MNASLLAVHTFLALALAGGGEREKGLKLYAEGRYEEAAAAFRLAIASEGSSPELQYNLALASWRAGDLAAAETAVEKYAAGAADARVDLHAGILGAVRYAEATQLEAAADQAVQAARAGQAGSPGQTGGADADPLGTLRAALKKAEQARDHFVRGATVAPSPELLRNTERALRLIDELKRKIEELEQQQEQQQDDQQQDGQEKNEDDSEQQKDEQKKSEPDEQEKGEGEQNEQEQGEPKPDEPQQEQGSEQSEQPEQQPGEQENGGEQNESGGEQPPEPQPEPEPQGENQEQSPEQQQQQQPEPGAGEEQPEEPKSPSEPPPPSEAQAEPQARNDAPGEGEQGRALTPEQTQRLFEQLKELDRQLDALRARGKSRRTPVERDW
ncbi:MAG: hypothetical protein KDE27_14075 [Planctomycetes bacterium]|nr:hypothetical protein [Planctomycetota bacterium]